MNQKKCSALAELVGHENVGAFLADYLENIPYLSSVLGDRAANELLSVDDIDRFFSTIKYRTSECFLVNGDSPVDVSEFAYRGVVDTRKAIRLFGEGATIVLNRVHLYHSPLSEICLRLAAELGAPCQANVYLTPPNAKGFNLHYDTHDVFMLQCSGAKQWRVYRAALELPLASQGTSGRLDVKDAPDLEAELVRNQSLYIPRGWLHEGKATSSLSLHITFGVYFFTWADAILESISRRLLSDRKFRKALPLDFLRPESDMVALQDKLARLIADVASSVDIAALKRSFSEQRKNQMQINATGLLKQTVLAQNITDDTRFRANGEAQYSFVDVGDALVIDVPQGTISVKQEARNAALLCLSGETVSLAQLADWLPSQKRIDLVRSLIVAEIVNVVE